MIYKKIVKLIYTARCLYFIFFVALLTDIIILLNLTHTTLDGLSDQLRVVSIISSVLLGAIFLTNFNLIIYFWSMAYQYTQIM